MSVQVDKYWTFPGASQAALTQMKKPYGPIELRWALQNILGFNNVKQIPEAWFHGSDAAKWGSPRFQSPSNNQIDIRIVPYEVVLMIAKSG